MADPISATLWLIALLLLATVGGLFLLGHSLQGKAEAGLKRPRSDMRRFKSERKQLELVTETYSVNDPEPYRSQVTDLRQKLAILRQRSEQLERCHVTLHQRAVDASGRVTRRRQSERE